MWADRGMGPFEDSCAARGRGGIGSKRTERREEREETESSVTAMIAEIKWPPTTFRG